MKFAFTAVALATTLALPAWAQNLAIVNGKPVPSSRVNALVQQVERSGRPVDDAMRAQIKEELILREIFTQEAERRGLRASAAYKTQAELATQAILIRELFADFARKNPVSDAEVKAEYDKFAAANAGQEYRARHILVKTEAEAKTIIEQLKKGASFEETAKKASIDTGSGANGGDLGWIGPNDCAPELANELFYQSNRLGGQGVHPLLVHTRYGFHIIEVLARRHGRQQPFEEVHERIRRQLTLQSRATAWRQYMLLLVGQAELTHLVLEGADSPLVQ